ncbi:MAG: PHP domain-containing protein [Eubacteriales bacterium]|nr:PHP domain-containing protein [Eubacteriales bacterium]
MRNPVRRGHPGPTGIDMRAYCDLHIHSCLSPCANDDMTPWNLVGMAKVKGLDVIALTDHNSALNIPQAMAAGEAYGIQVIPGMEVTSREEVHMLAYFRCAAEALAFGEAIYAHLPDVANRGDLFGNQIVIGDEDKPVGTVEKLLLNATDLSVEDVEELARKHGGISVPAHINRGANGMIGALGLMPPLPMYPVVEVAARIACPEAVLKGRFVLYSSDAHRLEDIAERDFALEVCEPSAAAVFALLNEKINWQ